MTVALFVKVYDGIVLATDSATTLGLTNGSSQVYNSADKLFHLHRNLPIAAMTWGLGQIGPASIATLAKDLRAQLMGVSGDPSRALDPLSYTMEQVAERVVQHFHGDLFAKVFAKTPPPSTAHFNVAGYSAGANQPESWLINLDDASVTPSPQLLAGQDAIGWLAHAQPAATDRLWNGLDNAYVMALQAQLDPAEWSKVEGILMSVPARQTPVVPAMPLPDAIDLARFMVEVTAGYSHYLLGPDTVGGPVDVAAISRHEGFRWIHRKHYYSGDINPNDTGHST